MEPKKISSQFKLFNPSKKYPLPSNIKYLNIIERKKLVNNEIKSDSVSIKISNRHSKIAISSDSTNDCSVPKKYLELNQYFPRKNEKSFHSYQESKYGSIIRNKPKKQLRFPSILKISALRKNTQMMKLGLSIDNESSKSLSFYPKIETCKSYHKQTVLSNIFSRPFCPNKLSSDSLDITHLKSREKEKYYKKRKNKKDGEYRFGVTPRYYSKLIEVLNLDAVKEEAEKTKQSNIVLEDELIDTYKQKGDTILQKYSTTLVKSYVDLKQDVDSNKKRKINLQFVETIKFWIDSLLKRIKYLNYQNKEDEINTIQYVYIYAINLLSKNTNEVNEQRIKLMLKFIISLFKLWEDKKEEGINMLNGIKDNQRKVISKLNSQLSYIKSSGRKVEKENEEMREFLISKEKEVDILDSEKKELIEKINKLEFQIELEEKNKNNPFS